MSDDARTVFDQARRLTPDQQSELVDLLLADETWDDTNWAQTWAREADRRLTEALQPGAELIDSDNVLAEGRTMLRLAREKQAREKQAREKRP
jgi:hypothetical protein